MRRWRYARILPPMRQARAPAEATDLPAEPLRRLPQHGEPEAQGARAEPAAESEGGMISLGIACPNCGGDSEVKDSRPARNARRRQHVCCDCGLRFTIWERIETPVRIADLSAARKKAEALAQTANDLIALIDLLRSHQPETEDRSAS